MRGMVVMALFSAAMLLGSAQAQMRGGFAGHAGGGMRGGFVGRAPVAPRGMTAIGIRGGVPGTIAVRHGVVGRRGVFGFNHFNFCRFGRCFAQPFFSGFRHHRRGFFGFGFGGFGAFPFLNTLSFGLPYYGYGAPAYSADYSSYSSSIYDDLAERERLLNDLEDQRRRAEDLRMELADLQASANAAARAATKASATPAPTSTEQAWPATTLVFRDNNRLEVQNYAIVGDKLYEFGPHWKRTIAISDLDVPATMKANEDRGIRFQIPSRATKSR